MNWCSFSLNAAEYKNWFTRLGHCSYLHTSPLPWNICPAFNQALILVISFLWQEQERGSLGSSNSASTGSRNSYGGDDSSSLIMSTHIGGSGGDWYPHPTAASVSYLAASFIALYPSISVSPYFFITAPYAALLYSSVIVSWYSNTKLCVFMGAVTPSYLTPKQFIWNCFYLFLYLRCHHSRLVSDDRVVVMLACPVYQFCFHTVKTTIHNLGTFFPAHISTSCNNDFHRSFPPVGLVSNFFPWRLFNHIATFNASHQER